MRAHVLSSLIVDERFILGVKTARSDPGLVQESGSWLNSV
jgi:hypothetical protein